MSKVAKNIASVETVTESKVDDGLVLHSKPSVEVAVDADKIGEMFETGDRDVSPMTKATKYEGEDQMLFSELTKG